MNNTKTTKRALLTSVVAIFMCIAMLAGTTFAWFTDSASTAVNKIQAGTLDVVLEMKDASGNWVSAEGKTLQFKVNGQIPAEETQILWEPGCTYELPELRVVNNGNLALKYKIAITGINGDAKLNEAIEWTITNTSATTALDADHPLAAGASDTLTIKGHMKEDAGNEYQGLSIDGISITVYATQLNSENDSLGSDYDSTAEYTKKNVTIMAGGGKTITLENGKTYTVGNGTVVVSDTGDVTYTNTGVAQTVTINTDGGTLTVNAPNDTVYHYGEANFVNINAVAGNSFHEFGKVDVLSITTGRVVIENGDNVTLTQVKSETAVIAVPKDVVLGTALAKANGVTEIKLQKGDDTPVVIKETEDWNKPEEEIPAELKNVIGSAVTEANDNYVARIGNNFYETLVAALNVAQPGDTVLMLKDFVNADLSKTVNLSLKNGVTLDGKGHKIIGNVGVYMCSAAGTVSTINNVIFENIHNDRVVSDDDCDYYGWKNGKVGMQSAIYASGLQGTANITNCIFNGVDWDAIQVTPKDGSTLNIIGNTFMHSDTEFSQLRYIHVQADGWYTEATVNVNNNSFYNTKHLNDPEILKIGVWYVSPSCTNLTGNYFEYNPAAQVIETDSEVPGGISSLFPARSSAGAATSDLMPAGRYSNVAYLTLQKAIDSVSDVTLIKDNSENIIIPEGKIFNLYTDEFKMSGTVTNNGTLYATSGTNTEGTATIINNGTLQLGCHAAAGYSVTNNGTLNITYGKVYDLGKITNAEGGTVIITGGSFTVAPPTEWVEFGRIAKQSSDGTFVVSLMTDEEAVAAGAVARYNSATSPYRRYFRTLQEAIDNTTSAYLIKDNTENATIPEGNTFTLYTGSFKNTGILTVKGTLKITSGDAIDPSKITNAEGGTVIITGGTFITAPSSEWIPFGYKVTESEDETYTVSLMTDEEAIAAGAVARYKSATSSSRKYFKTLEEGLKNGAVYLLKDVNGTFTKDGMTDIYCGDFTLTGSLLCLGNTLYINDGTAIINRIECGTFYGGYSSGVANITVKDGTATSIVVSKNATVVIEGGNYTGSIKVTTGGTGSLTIKGGTFG